MDRNFHTDDFERLLREKSDEFRMYPSKRIWHSIYNNIHPGRKWPSVAMSITLIATLLLVGYLNTNNTNSYLTIDQKNPDQPIFIAQSSSNLSTFPTRSENNTDKENLAYVINGQTVPTKVSKTGTAIMPGENTQDYQFSVAAGSERLNIQPVNRGESISEPVLLPVTQSSNFKGVQQVPNDPATLRGNATRLPQVGENMPLAVPDGSSLIADAIPRPVAGFSGDLAKNAMINPSLTIATEDLLRPLFMAEVTKNTINTSGEIRKPAVTADDMAWIDNYALYNRAAPKKWASKLGWQLYVTPSVVYRVLLNNPDFNITQNTTPFVISPASIDINEEVVHTPSGGIEAGAGLKYFISRGIKLKGGLQFNYTRYNSHAYHNTHPVVTKLTMYDFDRNSAYEVYRSTPYSNKNGLESVKLHNETFQVSLPMGADFRLAGSDRLQWNFGLTIQPTYLVGGKSYLVSSDRRNYVKETSMLNRWNLNAGFETFITYQVNGLTFQAGPQFRSQLFSTNNKKFEVEEKIQNYGLKFGVSKTIR